MTHRPEVRALVHAGKLRGRRRDHTQALAFQDQAEARLQSAGILRQANDVISASDIYCAAIWDALRALMEESGLQLGTAKGEEGQHAITMEFGAAQLRNSSEEREAGSALDAIRSQRNANHYRVASPRLGALPRFAGIVVRAARSRIGSE